MVVSRRGFMKQGTLLMLATGASLGGAKSVFGRDVPAANLDSGSALQLPKAKSPGSLEFTKATFAAHVNTVFRIYPETSKAGLKSTLVSITDIGPVPDQAKAGRECFVLKFRGPSSLAQNSYRIEHDALGRFVLFLVPAGKNRKGSYYQAVINRLNS